MTLSDDSLNLREDEVRKLKRGAEYLGCKWVVKREWRGKEGLELDGGWTSGGSIYFLAASMKTLSRKVRRIY